VLLPQLDALLDRALRVQLGGDVGTADDAGCRPGSTGLEGRHELVVQAPHGLLSGAHHHGVDLEHTRLAVDRDV
jgi:hypothetical protein